MDTNEAKVRERWPDAFVKAHALAGELVFCVHANPSTPVPETCLGVGDSKQEAWQDAADAARRLDDER